MTEEIPGVVATIALPSLARLAVPGVYFLMLDGAVVYVGKAVDIRRRIGQHITDGIKMFDAVSFVACPIKRLDRVERHYIEKFIPKYNNCALASALRTAGRMGMPVVAMEPVWEEMLDTAAAAALLGVEVAALKAWRKQGDGPPGRRRPRSSAVAYHPNDLRAFAANRQ